MRRAWSLTVLASVLGCAALGCSDVTTNLVRSDAKRDAAPRAADGGPIKPTPDVAIPRDAGVRIPALCGKKPCACDDGTDNDGDALIDGLDPECTGAYDNDESSFGTGAPPAARAQCADCFWDANKGSGDDDCKYPAQCLLGESPTRPGSEACSSCEPSQRCIDTCAKSTPNGCDCFGCCDITREDGSRISVVLNDQCALSTLDDVKRCPRCVQNPTCKNTCGMCELCPGRKDADLPALCTQGQPVELPIHACDEGQQVCSTEKTCPADYYCQLGCCLYIVQ